MVFQTIEAEENIQHTSFRKDAIHKNGALHFLLLHFQKKFLK